MTPKVYTEKRIVNELSSGFPSTSPPISTTLLVACSSRVPHPCAASAFAQFVNPQPSRSKSDTKVHTAHSSDKCCCCVVVLDQLADTRKGEHGGRGHSAHADLTPSPSRVLRFPPRHLSPSEPHASTTFRRTRKSNRIVARRSIHLTLPLSPRRSTDGNTAPQTSRERAHVACGGKRQKGEQSIDAEEKRVFVVVLEQPVRIATQLPSTHTMQVNAACTNV